MWSSSRWTYQHYALEARKFLYQVIQVRDAHQDIAHVQRVFRPDTPPAPTAATKSTKIRSVHRVIA